MGKANGTRKPQTRFKKLRDLPIFNEIDRRIREGEGAPALAAWIQQSQGYLTHTSAASLQKMLQRYKKTLPLNHFADPKKALTPTQYEEKAATYTPEIIELRELESLIKIQKERIQIDLTIEKNIKKLTPSLRGEISELQTLLITSYKMKQNMGFIQGGITGVGDNGGADTKQLLGNLGEDAREVASDSTSRAKILRAIDLAKRVDRAADKSNTEKAKALSDRTNETVVDL